MKKKLRFILPVVFALSVLFSCFEVFAARDLEAMYIERTPKYYSYQGRVQYGGKTFTDDFTPYYATYAYGLSEQDGSTKRWPDPGEIVTFTVHFRERDDRSSSWSAECTRWRWKISEIQVSQPAVFLLLRMAG